MPTLTLLATVILYNHADCLTYLQYKITTLPEQTHITIMHNQNIIELYGAHAILQCTNNTYKAYLLESAELTNL